MTAHTSPDPSAVMQAASAALTRGEAARARDLLQELVAANRADAPVWLLLAQACGALGDHANKVAAIDRALALAPKDLRALLAKAEHLAGVGDQRAASAFYSAALQYMPQYDSLPAPLQDGLRRAQAEIQRLTRELEDFVRARLDAEGANAAPIRFKNAVDILFGRKRVYLQDPRYLYYPGLPQIEFYSREDFPWLNAVEAATPEIRKELAGVVGPDFKPYVQRRDDRPQHSQAGMAGNPDWSAYFLRKDGSDQPGAGRCPRTLAALAAAPLARIPRRAPSILFSKLAAGARIPPHTGMLNARLICHLPLVVPEGCEFRVGNETRQWREGRAWVFDDTIEHEAWNRSSADRYILIFDIWRPDLSDDECRYVASLCEALDTYRGDVPWDA